MSYRRVAGRVSGLTVAFLFAGFGVGCGAKTGLKIPDAAVEDAECIPGPLDLRRRGSEVLFLIDRSGSMEESIDGDDVDPGEPSRWDLMAMALDRALRGSDRLIEVGAKFFPQSIPDDTEVTPENGCGIDPGIDLAPAPGNVDALLSFFRPGFTPRGGTPIADALDEAVRFLVANRTAGVPQFIVLATDGGPNCHPEGADPLTCTCVTDPADCREARFGAYNCLDEPRTQDALREAVAADIPVFVVGIEHPGREDLNEVLDRMAITGGRPREVPGERPFYNVREPADLAAAFDDVAERIATCVFVASPEPPGDADVQLSVGGAPIPRDASHLEGWDWTNPDDAELTLYGESCDRARRPDVDVTGTVACRDE